MIFYNSKRNVQKFQSKGKFPEATMDSVYTRFPALRKMGEVVMVSDPEFTREKTGAGSIEYFSPEVGRDTIRYPNGYKYPHPAPGKHAIVVNQNDNDEQDIALDMLHGMRTVPEYAKKLDKFKQAFMNSQFRYDIARGWEDYNKATRGVNDGREAYINNQIDGVLRNLLLEGDSEHFKKRRYWDKARDVYFQDKGIYRGFKDLEQYLKTK